LAVIEGGEAVANRCRFADNGWNGAAAIGAGSRLEVRDSESQGNFEHGIESWDGAAVTLVNNRCEGNSRNGIHADNGDAAAVIEGNQLIANREFGLVLGSAGSGKISNNTARENLLGGFVIRHAASAPAVTGNQATLNRGPGLVLEKGLPADAYASNKSTQNTAPQILTDADLASDE
jgi:parallel beta-helix repeat protein